MSLMISEDKLEFENKTLFNLITGTSSNELMKYLKKNNIKLNQWNTREFDILIFAIENDATISMIKFIINECHYRTLNYFIFKDYEYKSPLSSALTLNKFEIADLLLQNKADINYRMNDTGIYQNLFYRKKINKKNLLYILKRSKKINWIYPKINLLIDDCIYRNNNDLIKFIFNFFIFDNKFILEFIHIHKEKKGLSIQQLKDRITKEKNKIKIVDNWYDLAFGKENYEIFNIFLENDPRDRNDILKPLLKSREYLDQLYAFNKLNDFIDKVKNGKLNFDKKSPILNIMSKISLKRDKVRNLIENNKVKELEEFIEANSISLMDLNGHRFDVLIYSIECNSSINMINFIISRYACENFNYYIMNDTVKTPFIVALVNNRFDVADLLLKVGADINYQMFQGVTSSIICYIYEHDLMNRRNLKYLLNHANLKKSYVIDFINMLSKKKSYSLPPDIFLDIVMKHYIFGEDFILYYLHLYKNRIPLSNNQLKNQIQNEQNKIIINDWWYKKALDKDNYHAFEILFKHDSRDKIQILNKIFKLYDCYDKANHCEKSNSFINKLKSPSFKIPIDSHYFDGIHTILKHKKNIIKLIKDGNTGALGQYLLSNKIILKNFNQKGNYWRSEDGFDILIYAIENSDVSLEMVKYIISYYDHLNYTNQCYFNYKYDFDYNHENEKNHDYNYYYSTEDADFNYYFRNTNKPPLRTPLFSAIANRRFELVDLLIENGADINFQVYGTPEDDIIHLLYRFRLLSEDKLTFILNHGFHVKGIIDSLDQELKTKNSYLLNFNFIGIIFQQYLIQESTKEGHNGKVSLKDEWYKIAIEKNYFNLIELFLHYDSRDMNTIFDHLYELFEYDNDDNYSPGKQYIFINHIKNEKIKSQVEDYFMNKVSNDKPHARKQISELEEEKERKKKIRLN